MMLRALKSSDVDLLRPARYSSVNSFYRVSQFWHAILIGDCRPSVSLSHCGIASKRMHISSNFCHHHSRFFSRNSVTNFDGNTPMNRNVQRIKHTIHLTIWLTDRCYSSVDSHHCYHGSRCLHHTATVAWYSVHCRWDMARIPQNTSWEL